MVPLNDKLHFETPKIGMIRELLYQEQRDPDLIGMSPLSSMLHSWFHRSILPTILRNYDRASMAHGIEVRMPFMDWRLVTYAFALPEESKIGNGFTKAILRTAMKGLMPDSIRCRTNKIGFTTPLDEWARSSMADWFNDIVSSRSFQQSDLWDGKGVRTQLDLAMSGKGSIATIWPLINAHCLQKAFISAAKV
jgi:asparagine synthase (glutamine-hydrolysing)